MKLELTAYQIADAFPEESKEYIPKILPILKSKLIDQRKEYKKIDGMSVPDSIKNLFRMFAYYGPETELLKLNKMVEKYEKVIEIMKQKEDALWMENTQKIAVAKAKPIEHLYDFQKRRDSANRIHVCCPFHQDTKPSMMIYKNTNTFNCFSGCGGGDAIFFIMKLNNVNFKEAVRILQ